MSYDGWAGNLTWDFLGHDEFGGEGSGVADSSPGVIRSSNPYRRGMAMVDAFVIDGGEVLDLTVSDDEHVPSSEIVNFMAGVGSAAAFGLESLSDSRDLFGDNPWSQWISPSPAGTDFEGRATDRSADRPLMNFAVSFRLSSLRPCWRSVFPLSSR